jgi:hypothetical protein
MNESSDPRRLVGPLRFVAELSAVAAECARTGAWSDDLTVRRRLRDDVAAVATRRRPARKAL